MEVSTIDVPLFVLGLTLLNTLTGSSEIAFISASILRSEIFDGITALLDCDISELPINSKRHKDSNRFFILC